jgi:hypothetical protein
VFFADDQHELVVEKFDDLQNGRIKRERGKTDVRDAFENVVDGLFGRGGRPKNQLDRFVRVHEFFKKRREKINQRLRCRRDADTPG